MARQSRPRTTKPPSPLSKLPNITDFVDGVRQITLGRIGPSNFAAVAADDHNTLAALCGATARRCQTSYRAWTMLSTPR